VRLCGLRKYKYQNIADAFLPDPMLELFLLKVMMKSGHPSTQIKFQHELICFNPEVFWLESVRF